MVMIEVNYDPAAYTATQIDECGNDVRELVRKIIKKVRSNSSDAYDAYTLRCGHTKTSESGALEIEVEFQHHWEFSKEERDDITTNMSTSIQDILDEHDVNPKSCTISFLGVDMEIMSTSLIK